MILSEVCEGFKRIEDRTEQYAYLIRLGRALPRFPEDRLASAVLAAPGCPVWLDVSKQDGKLEFTAGVAALPVTRSALLLRGVAVLLLSMFNGKTAAEIAGLPVDTLCCVTGIESFSTPAIGAIAAELVRHAQRLAQGAV